MFEFEYVYQCSIVLQNDVCVIVYLRHSYSLVPRPSFIGTGNTPSAQVAKLL